MFVWIRPDGALRFVYGDALRGLLALEQPAIHRASHVEPTPEGRWTADLGPMDGPALGPFETRSAALDAELAWLIRHFNTGHPETGDLSCDRNHSRPQPPPPRTSARPDGSTRT
jgi:hypothetical protein